MFEVKAAKAGVERTRQRLAASDQGAPPSTTIPVVLFGFLLRFLLNMRLDNLFDVANLDQHILGLEICVDNPTLAVHII